MAKAAYAFFGYRITDPDDQEVDSSEHVRIIRRAAGVYIPHRKSDPSDSDHDTLIFRVKRRQIEGQTCVIFDVGRRIVVRVEHRYDQDSDELTMMEVIADDTVWTHIVMVPELGRLAVRDGGTDRLTAEAGLSRARSVIRHLIGLELECEKSASSAEVNQAVNRLALTSFSFTARPFNPHPSIPGEQIDALLKKANIAKMTAKAEPALGSVMSAEEEGLISETMGLAQKGYAQVGFRGLTEEGVEVAYKKPKLEDTRQQNLKQQAKGATIKILIPNSEDASEETYVVRTMLELYREQ